MLIDRQKIKKEEKYEPEFVQCELVTERLLKLKTQCVNEGWDPLIGSK